VSAGPPQRRHGVAGLVGSQLSHGQAGNFGRISTAGTPYFNDFPRDQICNRICSVYKPQGVQRLLVGVHQSCNCLGLDFEVLQQSLNRHLASSVWSKERFQRCGDHLGCGREPRLGNTSVSRYSGS